MCFGLRETVIPGLNWVLGDGKTVRFWKDKWLIDRPMEEVITGVLTPMDLERRVCELWTNEGGWILNRIDPYLQDIHRLRLRSVVVDTITGAKDRLSWGATEDGKFTVSSAYVALTRGDVPRPNLAQGDCTGKGTGFYLARSPSNSYDKYGENETASMRLKYLPSM